MRAGELRHRVVLKAPNQTKRNTYNEEIPDFVPVVTIWASVEPFKGREYLEAQKIRAELLYRIRIRPYPGVTSEWQVEFQGRTFEVTEVILLERNQEMQLICVEKVR